MTMHKTYLGLDPDGSGRPYYSYIEDDPSVPVVVTGPVYGNVELPDGTLVSVDDHVISVPCTDHPHEDMDGGGAKKLSAKTLAKRHEDHKPSCAAQLVAHAIGLKHEAEGHPAHLADPEAPAFRYDAPAFLTKKKGA